MDVSVCVKDFFVCVCIRTAQVCVCLGGCVRGEALKWIHAGVHSAWQENLLLAIPRLRNTTKTKHTRRKHTQRHIQYTQGHTQLERQYSMRQESGLQSTIPASSYLVGNILENRPNQTRQVWSAKKHGSLDSAHLFGFHLHSEILYLSALTL